MKISITVFRGVVVDFDQVIKYLIAAGQADAMIKFSQSWYEELSDYIIASKSDLKITDKMTKEEMIREYLRIDEPDGDLKSQLVDEFSRKFIHTWKCDSKLCLNKFVLGYELGKIFVDDRDEKIMTVDNFYSKQSYYPRDERTLTKLKLIGLKGPLQNICIPGTVMKVK